MGRIFRKKSFVLTSCIEPQPPNDNGKKVKCLPWSSLFIILSSFFCYINSLNCGLVFDDRPAIINNMDLRPKTSWLNLLQDDFWGTPMHKEESHKSYRPFCVLTFRINYLIHELQPFGYHLVNVILHVIVCLLYHRFCRQLLSKTPSFVAAMLFAVHPIHTEAVTGVVGRAELLSSIFVLLAFQFYIKSRLQHSDYKALSQFVICLGLAMLSKEQGITIVAVCVTYDIMLVQKNFPLSLMPEKAPRGKIKGPTPTWRKDLVLRLLVVAVSTIVLLIFRMKLMGDRLPIFNKFDNPAAAEPWPSRHLTHHYLALLNSWLLIFPADLCCDWTMGTVPIINSIADKRVFLTLIFYTVICKLVWTSYRSRNRISIKIIMAVSMCVFPFLPASNLFYSVGFVIAERILYIPSMGYCLVVAHGWYKLCLFFKKRTTVLRAFLVILLCLNATRTVFRNFDWKDEETLFKSGLRFTNVNAKLYNNLGHVMETKGNHEEALELFLQAAKVQPDDLGSHLNVGRMYNTLGMTQKAEEAFWQAKNLLPKKRPGQTYQTHIVPRHMDLFLNLGNLLSQNLSRLEEAQELYKEAISMKNDYVDAYMQRASVLLRLNRSQEAQEMYKEAMKHDQRNPDLFYNMGVLLLEQGKSLQALARFDQALQVDPEHEKSLLNYAILSQDSGDSNLRRLAHERLQVLLDKGQQPERTYFNMGMLAMQDRDISKAEHYFRKALQLKVTFDAALFNLALVLYETSRPLEALPFLQKLDQKHLKGLVLLGNIYFNHMNNYTAAKQCYELILQQDPYHVPALHNLCAVHYQLKELEAAEQCLLRATTLAPKESYIQHHLDLVREHRKKSSKISQKPSSKVAHCNKPDDNCNSVTPNNSSNLPYSLKKNNVLSEDDKKDLRL